MISYPTIPENIVVHLGSPTSDAQNVTETFPNYIKNVASSEVYPTWPEEALKANIMAQISVALNRVYTEYYRSSGKNFDITNSPAYDQTYIYQRTIYSNISKLVDEIFNSYIRREGYIEPLFATFCDGIEVECNGLSQWGSLELAERGLDYVSILKNYYGDDIEIVRNVDVDNISGSAPIIPLREGDTGYEIEQIQTKLNRISTDFPDIPKIYPVDGFFDTSTLDAVKKFQEVFGLTPDGIVGSATWYKINFIYIAVKQLQNLDSEGLRLDEISTQYEGELKIGDSSRGVIVLQYYLNYIAKYVSTVSATDVDGSFGPNTENSVISFQKTYNLPETGIVDRLVWERIQNTYYSLISAEPYQFSEGVLLPFPGRVLRVGITGNDVRALQEYLNYIARSYPQIPTVTVDGDFGAGTEEAVRALKILFNLPGAENRVTVETWDAIVNIYDDLYTGSTVNEGQYPGYVIE